MTEKHMLERKIPSVREELEKKDNVTKELESVKKECVHVCVCVLF